MMLSFCFPNQKNMRNFIRKWGTMVRHDPLMKPLVAPKYDIGFVVKNCSYEILYELEPWCSTIYVNPEHIAGYIGMEQDNTLFNLKDRIKYISDEVTNDVVVEFDVKELSAKHFNFISNLSDVISDSGEIGEMEYDIFKITINKLKTYERSLIKCER